MKVVAPLLVLLYSGASLPTALASGKKSEKKKIPKKGKKGDDDNDNASMAMTLWWVIFNAPENCITRPSFTGSKCGELDYFGQAFLDSLAAGTPNPGLITVNTAAELGILYANGAITQDNGDLDIVASLWRTDDPLEADPNADPLQFGIGWTNPNAEIQVILRTHGAPVFDEDDGYLTQISNLFDPYCEDRSLLFEGEKFNGNVCTCIQDVRTVGGYSGEVPLQWMFAGGRYVEGGARAIVNRRQDLVQIRIETNIKCPDGEDAFDECYMNTF